MRRIVKRQNNQRTRAGNVTRAFGVLGLGVLAVGCAGASKAERTRQPDSDHMELKVASKKRMRPATRLFEKESTVLMPEQIPKPQLRKPDSSENTGTCEGSNGVVAAVGNYSFKNVKKGEVLGPGGEGTTIRILSVKPDEVTVTICDSGLYVAIPYGKETDVRDKNGIFTVVTFTKGNKPDTAHAKVAVWCP